MEGEQTKNFGQYLDQTMRAIRHHYLKQFREAGVDITTEQWVILSALYDENGQSQTNLANGTYKNAPTVSRIIDLLCEKGLTSRMRFEGDRRRYKVFLTDAGKKTVEILYPRIHELRKTGWNGLTDGDYDHFIRILNTIFENFATDSD